MAFALSTALQPPVRAAHSQSVLLEPRPRTRLEAAFASFGFAMPRSPLPLQQEQLPQARGPPADSQQELEWPDDCRMQYKLGRVYGHVRVCACVWGGGGGSVDLARLSSMCAIEAPLLGPCGRVSVHMPLSPDGCLMTFGGLRRAHLVRSDWQDTA